MRVAIPKQQFAEEAESVPSQEPVWTCVVWDDPVNLMAYVTYVFQTYFGYEETKARALMLQVHNEGKSAVSSGTREKIEMDVQAMHNYGLWATMSQEGA